MLLRSPGPLSCCASADDVDETVGDYSRLLALGVASGQVRRHGWMFDGSHLFRAAVAH